MQALAAAADASAWAAPVTEAAHARTAALATPPPPPQPHAAALAAALAAVDTRDLFPPAPETETASLASPAASSALAAAAGLLAATLAGGRGLAAVSGAGTSGRLAFLLARAARRPLARRAARAPGARVAYVLAGGDAAVFLSREAPEDNWRAGQQRLAALAGELSAGGVFVLGVTAGLSAPFVAAQLDWALAQPAGAAAACVLGFNPPRLARDVPVEGWDQTPRRVVARMLAAGHPVLTPLVGPEAVTGSTRMKSGSATKVVLETLLALALRSVDTGAPPAPEDAAAVLAQYARTVAAAHASAAPALPALIDAAGRALAAGRRILYFGQGPYGILGLIDASECPPTYNADRHDVRGFLDHGYATLANDDGDLAAALGDPAYALAWEDAPPVQAGDLVVFIPGDLPLDPRATPRACAARAAGACVALLTVGAGNPEAAAAAAAEFPADIAAHVVLPAVALEEMKADAAADAADPASAVLGPSCHWLAELAVKLVLNAISTGAHVLKGKVLGNLMIDLQVSNNKLFHRAAGIVAIFSEAPLSAATQALLRALYSLDSTPLPADITDAPLSAHIAQAAAAQRAGIRVVPTAVVLATCPHLTAAEAAALLAATPMVGQLLADLRNRP
jgi:N-acetylmuramic acid 6-phosphate (MurNAc-6-P) etherase